ncbi:MAG: hypothetical protein N3G78_00665 [Desulfobacterota bacterium]|nr:hypothetical protein [Thermodesulfobacteriota bacterium]
MARKKILLIGGSLNQTTMMHQIAQHLHEYDCFFTPFYADGLVGYAAKKGWADFSVLGGPMRRMTLEYLRRQDLPIDEGGRANSYDLVLTGSDLIIQKNIRGKKIILIQEGMTDPENLFYYLVKWFRLPRYLASTAAHGLSHQYERFCVASEGYRDLFIRKGVSPEKIVVTGIPNFDNAAQYLNNPFPYRHYVLVATSDARETFKYDNRKRFIRRALEIADGRQLIFKLHPNEKVERATREILKLAPRALIFARGNTNHMIANCDVLVTQYSSVVYIGLALGKEVHSYFDLSLLKRLMPIQNGGASAKNIAEVCKTYLQ